MGWPQEATSSKWGSAVLKSSPPPENEAQAPAPENHLKMKWGENLSSSASSSSSSASRFQQQLGVSTWPNNSVSSLAKSVNLWKVSQFLLSCERPSQYLHKFDPFWNRRLASKWTHWNSKRRQLLFFTFVRCTRCAPLPYQINEKICSDGHICIFAQPVLSGAIQRQLNTSNFTQCILAA